MYAKVLNVTPVHRSISAPRAQVAGQVALHGGNTGERSRNNLVLQRIQPRIDELHIGLRQLDREPIVHRKEVSPCEHQVHEGRRVPQLEYETPTCTPRLQLDASFSSIVLATLGQDRPPIGRECHQNRGKNRGQRVER
jgi:hypothetical protein